MEQNPAWKAARNADGEATIAVIPKMQELAVSVGVLSTSVAFSYYCKLGFIKIILFNSERIFISGVIL